MSEAEITNLLDRVEIDPRRCGGTPVIRGTRIPVVVILDQLDSGESGDSILRGYPELTREDVQAATAHMVTGSSSLSAANGAAHELLE